MPWLKHYEAGVADMRHHEDDIQRALFAWIDIMAKAHPEYRNIYHIPNGGKRNAREAARLKAQGVRAGVPDICIAYPSGLYNGMYIELKAGKNKPTEKQAEWLSRLAAAGYKAVVCRGFDDAKAAIENYYLQNV